MSVDEPTPALETVPNIFEVWQAAPDPSIEAVSFGATSTEPAADISVWRLNLPADPNSAVAQLNQAETQIQATENVLNAIPQQLDQFVQRQQTTSDGATSFSTSDTTDLTLAEIDMLELLETVQQNYGVEDEQAVSFGLGDKLGDWGQVNDQFQALVQRLQRLLNHYAWVETRVQDELLGQTIVSWTGDMRTAWEVDVGSDQQALHYRSLKLALASRQTMLRIIVIASEGAAKLSTLLTMPGGALLALPVAWKYIDEILTEINQYRAIST